MTVYRDHFGGQTIWMALLDVVSLCIGVVTAIGLRLGFDELGNYLLNRIDGWIFFCGSIIVGNYLAGSYGVQIKVSRFNLLVNWAFSLGIGLLVVSITSFAWFQTLLGRGVLLLTVGVYSLLWMLSRIVLYKYVLRSRFFAYRIAIIGTGELAAQARRMVEDRHILPAHRVVAFIQIHGKDERVGTEGGSLIGDVPVINVSLGALTDVVRSLGVRVLVIGLEGSHGAVDFYPQLRRLRFEGVVVMNALNAAEVYSGKVPLALVDEDWLMQASMVTATLVVMRSKRIIDVVTALVGCVISTPFVMLIALVIKISAPRSPVIYSQDRVGQFGRRFRIYKFRTMIDRAEEASGPIWSPDSDFRVTRVGSVLRRFRLDEIPQLVNIVKGDMSLVGPRPERPEIAAEIEKKVPFYRERENVVPGLTGWAQVRHPYGNTIEDAREKLQFDLYYIKNLSLTLDLQIVLRTLRIVVLGMERYEQ